jgi:drug/metabolite transporter (DMT)-like permease
MALLGTLQPMVTALIAQRLFAEKVGRRFWGGLLAGVTGVLLVLSPRLALADGDGLPLAGHCRGAAVGGGHHGGHAGAEDLACSSQPHQCQRGAVRRRGALVVAIAAWLLGESLWRPGIALWGALAWAVLLLSGVATTLLVWMVRRGSAARVTVLLLAGTATGRAAGLVAVRRRSSGAHCRSPASHSHSVAHSVLLCRRAAQTIRRRPR